MSAFVLRKVPNPDVSPSITSDDFSLIWVDDYIVDWAAVVIAALYSSVFRLPDFHATIFRARDHPLPFNVKCYACNVASMSGEHHDGIWVGRADIEEFDIVVASCSEVSFVWGYTETIDLRIRMLNCAMANTRQSFPESNCVVVAR